MSFLSRLESGGSRQRGVAGWQTVEVDCGVGAAVSLDLFLCVGARPGPISLITAGIHGDEYEGPAAIAQLAEEIRPERVNGTLLLLPVANPLAFNAGTRVSAPDGVNLARVFPGKSDGIPTERLAYFLWLEFVQGIDYLIDLHSGGVEYDFMPLGCFYGLPGEDNPSYQAARAFGLPVLWQLPDTPGVLSREVTRCGGIALGAEYRGMGQLSQQGVRDYQNGIKSCLAFWKALDVDVAPHGRTPRVFTNDWILAPATGIFHAACALGDQVQCGQLLATIHGTRGERVADVVAEQDGTVLGLRARAAIRERNWAVLVGVPLEDS